MLITQEMVDNWVGNHGYADKREEWMLSVIQEIANGEYEPFALAEDILNYNS